MSAPGLARGYGWTGAKATQSCGYLAPAVLAILRSLPVKRVLDLGCGNGALCKTLLDAGFSVVGVERDATGVGIARQAYPGKAFYAMSVEEDPATLISTEGQFDVVVSTEVVEHLFAPRFLPQFAAQVLKPNGYLIVSTPYHGYVKNLAIAVLGKWDSHHTSLWEGGHIKFWSRSTLTRLLEDNGFRVTRFLGSGRVPYFWKSMLLVAQRQHRADAALAQ